jgi:TatA/E family protein of Tat protein translocase
VFFGFLEFLGTTEFLVILFAALILFGPRRLPQLSRSLGKSLSEFKRASEDFKRTWEREVDLDGVQREANIARSMLTDDQSFIASTEARSRIVQEAADHASEPRIAANPTAAEETPTADVSALPVTIAADARESSAAASSTAPTPPARKRDWL